MTRCASAAPPWPGQAAKRGAQETLKRGLCEPNVPQELAAASDSSHSEDLLHLALAALPSQKAPAAFPPFSPLF